MLTIREQQIGLLEVIEYLLAIIAVIGAVAWKWDLLLQLALILVALPFVTWWEIQNLEHENDPSRRPRQTLAKEKAGLQGQTSGQPVTTATKQHSKNRVDPPAIETTEQKGTWHEPLECNRT